MRQWKIFRYKSMLVILAMFLCIGLFLFLERSGVKYQKKNPAVPPLESGEEITAFQAAKSLKKTCLIIRDSRDESSVQAWEQFQQIFLDMKVGYDCVDVAEKKIPAFASYRTAVILLSDLSSMGKQVLNLSDWVSQGGSALFALTLEPERYLMLIEQKLGMADAGSGYATVDAVWLKEGFMIGGGQSFRIPDAFDSARAVGLTENADVYAWSDDEKKIPLIWKTDYGKGTFVVDNFGICEKATRGFFAASYSLLEDICVYPVLNDSAFYLDDFPSPVPQGDGTYVRRDYGATIREFYTNIWWPDMMNLAQKYGVRYTGAIIENYEDDTTGNVVRAEDTEQFQYFGNMLLRRGGEIAYHGYNHQPLCLSDTDYKDVLPYQTWQSRRAMELAVSELIAFGDEMFPQVPKTVYVPPSNVLSDAGRSLLADRFPQIDTIASNYFSGDMAYEQEFEVAEDGLVEQPRIISGCQLNDYMRLAAVSELNMHFVNTHFMHPDDLLDEDRGAKLGWEELKQRLADYMEWLYSSAPCIRNLTGSELSGAIRRFAALSVEKEVTEEAVSLKLNHFYDEAYLMLRMNEGVPGKVTGGKLEHITGNLYLLCAEKNEIVIERTGE